MPVPGDINLVKTKTSLTPELVAFMGQLRLASFVGIGGVLVVGFLIGVSFLFLTNERNSLAETKKQLLVAIAADAKKEGLFISLKDRVPVVDRAIQNEKPWGQILDMVGNVILPPKLVSLAVDDHQVVSLSVKAGSVEEVAGWINSIIDLVAKKRVRSSQLVSLQLTKEGSMLVSFSFIPN